jgi:regulator of RNase E activity RraA
MAVRAVSVPVTVAGMDVAPGEIIHMDENGACKFPAHKLEAVLTNVRAVHDEEKNPNAVIAECEIGSGDQGDLWRALVRSDGGLGLHNDV